MLEFETAQGNKYAWCDDVGLIIPESLEMRAILNQINLQDPVLDESILKTLMKSYNEDEIKYCYKWIKKWRKIMPKQNALKIPQEILAESIKPFVLRHCLRQLILDVTEDCNFRCKYCTFSEYYEFTRGYSKRHMNFEVAKKAIDLYANLLKEGRRFNPWREHYIGFFGGEPLLNFDLIKECVNYIESRYGKWHYSMTTNGSLLDEEKGEWLLDHKFSILVSLDGPEEEHNRNRVFCDGRGTFNQIMKNLATMLEMGYKDIRAITVLDPKSDISEIEKFFQRNDVPPISRATNVTKMEGCKYYDQFSKEDQQFFLHRVETARTRYMDRISNNLKNNKKNPFSDALFYRILISMLLGPITLQSSKSLAPFTGTCVPGLKIFVDVEGNIHACERILTNFPIGNVYDGLNYHRIGEILKDYFHHMERCPSCRVRKLCNKCFHDFCTDQGFSSSNNVCQEIESSTLKSLSEAVSIAEIDSKLVDRADIKYESLMKWRV